MMRTVYTSLAYVFTCCVLMAPVSAEQASATVPASDGNHAGGFAITQQKDGLTITVNGQLFARYVIDQANKPYLWPIIGPTGKAMTRAYPMQDLASEEKSQRDHVHQRGLLFGHESIGDSDTWAERRTFVDNLDNPSRAGYANQRLAKLGKIQHREFTQLTASNDSAVVVEICDYLDPNGDRILIEERRLTFRADRDMRMIDFDQQFIATESDVVFADRKDAGLSIRVATTMAVDSKKGGKITNSEGQIDAEAWSQPARWVDYRGPVDGEQQGIAFLNHPSSFRHPTRWHVRNYGLFTANPFAQKSFNSKLDDASIELKEGEKLHLNHRLLFHKGEADLAAINEAWQQYAAENVQDAVSTESKKDTNSTGYLFGVADFSTSEPLMNAEAIIASGMDMIEPGLAKIVAMSAADFDAALKRIEENDICVRSVNWFLPPTLKVTGPEVDLAKSRAFLENALARMVKLGAKVVVFGSPNSRSIPDGFSRQQATEQMVEFLRLCADVIKENDWDIKIALEPINHTETNFVNTFAEGLAIVRQVDRPQIGLTADFYHFVMENEATDIMLDAPGLIHAVQLADPDGRTFPKPGKPIPGLDKFFGHLREIGYEGGVTVEAIVGDDLSADSRAALEVMKSLSTSD